jgi:RHS repeat-associated protein
VNGWIYDNAGNLLSDGTTIRTYDALHRVLTSGTTSYTYTGDGTLVSETTGGTTTRYTQDLAAPLSQILQTVVGSTRTNYLYGRERLAIDGSPRTWFAYDALGSVRHTLNDSGVTANPTSYGPWGTPHQSLTTPFGFAGELQHGSDLYLRARWYAPPQGRFVSRDPFAGFPEQPYSLNAYQYAYANPVLWTDPSGEVVYLFEGGWNEPSAAGSANPSDMRQIINYTKSNWHFRKLMVSLVRR